MNFNMKKLQDRTILNKSLMRLLIHRNIITNKRHQEPVGKVSPVLYGSSSLPRRFYLAYTLQMYYSLVTQILHNISPVDGCGYMIQYYCLSNNWDINVKLSVGTHPNPHFRLIPCSGNLAMFISKPCLFYHFTIWRGNSLPNLFVSEAPAVCVSPPLVPG